MSVESVQELLTRMLDEPEFAARVNDTGEEELAEVELSDAELEAVLADAATIAGAQASDGEVSGFMVHEHQNPGAQAALRSPTLAGFDTKLGSELGGRFESLIGSDVGILGARGSEPTR